MRRIILPIAGVIGLALVGFIAFTIYQDSHFRLVKTQPSNGAKVASLAPVEFNFNRTLSKDANLRFKITPYVSGKVSVDGQKLTFQPTTPYNLNARYTASVDKITSVGGESVSSSVTFEATYIRFDKLSPAQQQEQINQTDALTSANPLLAVLPKSTLHYQISYTLDQQQQPSYTVSLNAILLSESDRDIYTQHLRDYKKEALDFIRSNGGDPTKLKITYDPAEAKDL